ncbi:MAG: 2-oxo acid dehydrogenase subunit E2 [Clostridia bacterium]|nr:2-oxo acid dehydrogenase subunit E2 [Clostridia bacterium]
MFGKRYDGRRVKSIDPIQCITPYLMKTRTDSMNMFEESFPCDGMDAFIKAKRAEGWRLNYLHLTIASIVRTMALRPRLNRFVMNGRIYARPKIWVSFVVHHDLRSEDDGTTVKLCFEGTEGLPEICAKIDEAIARETTNHQESNSTDKLAKLITSIPGPLIKAVVGILMWMDRHNIMPKAVIEASPFHTSLFITNLRSLGINHVFHHVYEFGTTGIFAAIGKERRVPEVQGSSVGIGKHMGFGLVCDERFCDGLYFARSLKIVRKFLMDPNLLMEPLEKKVEDDA